MRLASRNKSSEYDAQQVARFLYYDIQAIISLHTTWTLDEVVQMALKAEQTTSKQGKGNFKFKDPVNVVERDKLYKELKRRNVSSNQKMFLAMKKMTKEKLILIWVIEGDENSKFFYGVINKRRSHLAIRGLFASGDWFTDLLTVKEAFRDHFVGDLEKDISHEEIRNAVWDCVVRCFPRGGNSSFIALIPKVTDAKFVADFRPISLIGSVYKVVTKILANRLAMIHGIFSSNMASVLINGSPTTEFLIYRGLKQGGPLAPFLFILIMESLHLFVSRAVNDGIFKGLYIRGSTSISHLFYADDALFIGEWSDQNLDNLLKILRCFHLASGLSINVNKSHVLGVGVPLDIVQQGAASIGCGIMNTPFKYLRVMVGDYMSRYSSWSNTIQKVRARLSKWKVKTLSVGGRLTLLKSVLGAVPIYNMSLFKTPKRVLREMEMIRNRFFNGGDDKESRITWVAWEKVLSSKKNGGLGVSSFFALNRALLFKWIWRFLSQDGSLWCHVICAIHDVLLEQHLRSSNSTWGAIIREAHLLASKGFDFLSHCKIRVGDGSASSLYLNCKWPQFKTLWIPYPGHVLSFEYLPPSLIKVMSTKNGVNPLAPNPAHNSNFSLLLVLGRERLAGPNYMDWMRNFRFTLRYENKEYYLDVQIPTIDDDSTQEAIEAHQKHYDDANKVSYILESFISPELQKTFENTWVYEMNQQLKEMFQEKASKEHLHAVKSIMACKSKPEAFIYAFVLEMKWYFERLESMNMVFDAELSINVILSGLPADYNQFGLSYQKNRKETSIIDIHSLLQTAEKGIKKDDVPSTSTAPVKSDHGSKRMAEFKIAPTSDSKEALYFYCNTKGPWKLSCPKYLKHLKDGKVKKSSHSGLKESRRLKHGELNLVMGNRNITPVTRIGKYELMLKSRVRIDLNNCCYSSKMTRNIISFHALFKDGYKFSFDNENGDILVYSNGCFMFKASPCKGIYEIVECISHNGNVLKQGKEPTGQKDTVNTATQPVVVTHVKPDDISLPIRKTSGRVSQPPQFYNGFPIEEDKISDGTLNELDDPANYKEAMAILEAANLKMVRCKWIFKNKTYMDGKVHTYKDRMVAKGYTQTHMIHYEETLLIVTKIKSVRILLAIDAFYDYEIWKIDVKTAFLNGKLKEDVFMAQPECFKNANEDESCIHVKVSRSVVVFLVLYVDDILLIGNDNPMLQSVKDWLGKCFAMKDLEDAAYILGIKIYTDRNLPLHHGIKISKDLCPKTDVELDKMSRILYASANPGEGHWTVVKNIFKCLRNTKDMFLVYDGEEKLRMSGYFDASWKTDNDDSHSQSGWVFLLNGGTVAWKSSKQDTVADSTCESEYIAACKASKEVIWMKNFIGDLGVVLIVKTPLKYSIGYNGFGSLAMGAFVNLRSRRIFNRKGLIKRVMDGSGCALNLLLERLIRGKAGSKSMSDEKVKALGANGVMSSSRVRVVWMEVGGRVIRARVASSVVVKVVLIGWEVFKRRFWMGELSLEDTSMKLVLGIFFVGFWVEELAPDAMLFKE
nr:RNA-directed DNA polymerase, eukaryota [Tanacetum cinerariifolium]